MRTQRLDVEVGPAALAGRLGLPDGAAGLVLFAHGSGSGRGSPRNRAVADELERAGCATLLFDLLSPEEADDRARVFDIPLLAGRLLEATGWAATQPGCRDLPVGYFGASTGAAAALWAAAEPGTRVRAIVSRGGRPDLAAARLDQVDAPTLLVVGSRDEAVLALNRQALLQLEAPAKLALVPGATHLFEEPGALDMVTRLARDWFRSHFEQPQPD